MIRGDDAWVTANKDIPANLSSYGGAYNGALTDSAVQEYNLKTGKLLYSWDALKHIRPGDSYATLPTNGFPWDAYHVNSLAAARERDLPRLDARHLGRLPRRHARRGGIEWTLGGKHSSFTFGRWRGVPVAARRRSATRAPRSRCSTTTAAS